MKRVVSESMCLFFKIDELTNWGYKLHLHVFTLRTVYHKYPTGYESQQM
jgi:hypothetical protein